LSISKRLPVVMGGLGAIVVLAAGASFAVGGQPDKTRDTRSALHGGKPKNVIFFLGDGMGDQEVTAARYYQYGAAGRLNLDRLPFTGFQTTWSVKPDGKPDYDPDSASTGTMWATGEKTLDERISQGPSSAITVPGKNLTTVLERPEAGDVSDTAADSTRAREELGFAPATSLSEGLRAEYEWVRRRLEAEPEKALRKAG
jgi:alkaline phosphatase